MFTAIFVSLFVAGWCFAALLPWLALSIRTRGEAGLAMLALCLAAGVVAGLAIPVLVREDGAGIWLSLLAAGAASAALLGLRRLASGRSTAEDGRQPGIAEPPAT